MVLTIAYFPPVEYFALLARYSSVYMEAHETYQKQSYRNRCHILSDNGVQVLNFPVKHVAKGLSIRDVMVDWSVPWLEKTKRCIDTAYGSAPFFEHYRDSLYALLDRREERLWDMNMSIIEYFVQKIGLETEILCTVSYKGAELDIHPKRPNSILQELGIERPYYQVFSERTGFVPNLSIMDLLFNEGPEALSWILE